MAKLYRDPQGGAFYDAFGGKLGEVEDIWFGDSFNRDAALNCCYATTDAASTAISADPATLSFTVKDCNWNPDALGVLKGEIGVYTPGTVDFVCNSDTSSVRDAIAELQKQIDELKAAPKAAQALRSALKTLQYKREVE